MKAAHENIFSQAEHRSEAFTFVSLFFVVLQMRFGGLQQRCSIYSCVLPSLPLSLSLTEDSRMSPRDNEYLPPVNSLPLADFVLPERSPGQPQREGVGRRYRALYLRARQRRGQRQSPVPQGCRKVKKTSFLNSLLFPSS